ncbi:MAG: uracil-DNA glycosylase [Steroidobacteraceae bacterium]
MADYLAGVRGQHPLYYAKPVPPFGDLDAPLLIVGLAPGMHGANRTGRPFTGDFAGILLYQTLAELGLGTQPASVAANDDLKLLGVRITNAVRCLPPQNKPTPAEIRECNGFLRAEIQAMTRLRAIVALGRIAHDAVLDAVGHRRAAAVFAHGAQHALAQAPALFDSYHCSRYNTQTRRLTAPMFKEVLAAAARCAQLVAGANADGG